MVQPLPPRTERLPPRIDSDARFCVAGRTGSGKTTLANWFLNRSSQHWVILNPKHTGAYRELPDSIVHRKFKPRELLSDLNRRKFVNLELNEFEAGAEYMDGIIGWLHGALSNVGLCCDELYTLHSGTGRAGPGLIGWLTRGRERRQSLLGLMQRPAWVSRFVFTEASAIIEMDLTFEEDRATLFEYTGSRYFLSRVLGHRWLYYDVARDRVELFGPVPLLNQQRSFKHG
jgi:hypothetical protein